MTAATLRKLLQTAGLSRRTAAQELDMSERMFRYYTSGEKPIPRVVELALLQVTQHRVKQ